MSRCRRSAFMLLILVSCVSFTHWILLGIPANEQNHNEAGNRLQLSYKDRPAIDAKAHSHRDGITEFHQHISDASSADDHNSGRVRHVDAPAHTVHNVQNFRTRVAETFPHQALWKAVRSSFSSKDVQILSSQGKMDIHPVALNLSVSIFDDRLSLQPSGDIILCFAASADRFDLLPTSIAAWDGPVIIGLFCEEASCLHNLESSIGPATYKRRNTAMIVVVGAKGMFYPINAMRNILFSYIPPGRGHGWFMLDSDFVLSMGAYQSLKSSFASTAKRNGGRRALVVPCFEFGKDSYDVGADILLLPRTKEELLRLPQGLVRPSKNNTYAKGHSCTEYERWMYGTDTDPWPQSTYQYEYEPFFIIEKTMDAPGYDEFLLMWGGDKQTYCFLLHLVGYQYYTVPNVFAVHHPHEYALRVDDDSRKDRQLAGNRVYFRLMVLNLCRYFNTTLAANSFSEVGYPVFRRQSPSTVTMHS